MSDLNEISKGLRWYVVHTYSGYENKVMISIQKVVSNRGLGDKIVAVRVPVEKVLEVKRDKEVEKENKLFPGYVMVKMEMNDETWHVVRNITGVTGFVGPGSRPTPISDQEVADLMLEEEAPAPTVVLSFKVGDTVQITGDVFEGQIGIVESISDDLSKAHVLSKRGRRDLPADIDTSHISPVK